MGTKYIVYEHTAISVRIEVEAGSKENSLKTAHNMYPALSVNRANGNTVRFCGDTLNEAIIDITGAVVWDEAFKL